VLFKEILKYTDRDNPFFEEIEECLQKTTEFTNYIDEKKSYHLVQKLNDQIKVKIKIKIKIKNKK
jgi:hypothetical protein